jgi:kinesin family protein 5
MAVASLDDADADTRVRVICRVRPRAPGEVGDGQYAECVQVESAESFVRVTKNAWDRPEAFAFDAVLPVNASQRRVYDAVCLPVVEAVLGGANGAVLAYGMTGSGKTYSLMHVGSKPASSDRGLVTRAAEEIFARARAEGPNVETRLAVGFVQIYNEEVYDLLVDETERPGGTTTPLRLVDRAGAAHCEGASARVARSADDVLALLAAGRRRRKEANLKLNASSSRSHAIITFHVSRSFPLSDVGRGVASAPRERRFTSKLSFADLAGSERVRRTGASGARLTEAGFINKSLAALGNCVHILAERGSRDDVGHVPYRDSKLTRLLRDCFGNGCRTSLLVTCSPDPTHAGETTTTLRFGQRAMRVETVVKTQRVAEYRAAVKRQASEVDRLQASLEDALALARNAKAEAAAELERERRKIVAEAERERERRVAVARERLEEDAEAKARAMVRTVTQKVASMLDLERGRMTEAMASERAAADASEAKVAAETKAVAGERDRLAVALAATSEALDAALKRVAETEARLAESEANAREAEARASEAESLVDKLAARLSKYAAKEPKAEAEAENDRDDEKDKDDGNADAEDDPAGVWSRALARAVADSSDSGREACLEATRALASLASDPSRHLELATERAVRPLASLLGDARADARARRAAAGVFANVAASPECHEALLDVPAFLPVLLGLLRDAREGENENENENENEKKELGAQTRLLATGALANLMGNPRLKRRLASEGALDALARVAASKEKAAADDIKDAAETRAQATRGLSNFCARHPGAGDAVCGVAGALEGLVDAAFAARLESARKHAALALYHVTRRPDLAARVVDAGGRRAMRALKSEAASEETRALAEMCLGALENAA